MSGESSHAVSEHMLCEIIRGAYLAAQSPAFPVWQGLDWQSLTVQAEQHGLAPLLYSALKHYPANLPAPIAERLKLAYVRSTLAADYVRADLKEIHALLTACNISVVLLKGAALAFWLYPDPGLRPLGDIDLLIAPEHMAQAQAELQRIGYELTAEVSPGFQEQFWSECTLVRRGSRPSQVDLHSHLITTPYYRQWIPIEWFWEQTSELSLNGVRVRTLTPLAQILYLASHAILAHPYERLIWFFDIALVLKQYSTQVDWTELTTRAMDWHIAPALAKGMRRVQSCWHASIPLHVLKSLAEYRLPPGEALIFASVTGAERPADAFLSGFTLPDRSQMVRYWLRQLFPSPAYMRAQYKIDRPWLVPFFYPWRVGASLYKVARSTIRLLLHERNPKPEDRSWQS